MVSSVPVPAQRPQRVFTESRELPDPDADMTGGRPGWNCRSRATESNPRRSPLPAGSRLSPLLRDLLGTLSLRSDFRPLSRRPCPATRQRSKRASSSITDQKRWKSVLCSGMDDVESPLEASTRVGVVVVLGDPSGASRVGGDPILTSDCRESTLYSLVWDRGAPTVGSRGWGRDGGSTRRSFDEESLCR